MRLSIWVWLLCMIGCGTAGVCATGCNRDCARYYSCEPDDWGNTGTDGTAGSAAAGGHGGSGTTSDTGGSGATSHTGGSGGGTGGSGGGLVCPDDPQDGDVPEGCGVWVCNAWGDNNNPGTQSLPLQTINQGIAKAAAGSKRVYACGGLYEEPVALPPGFSLYGGYYSNPDTKQWTWQGSAQRATIAPLPGFVALTFLEGNGGEAKSWTIDIVARSADAIVPGGSSIAVIIQEKAKSEARRIEVIAGKGADGADGKPGDYAAQPAKNGPPGNDGANACTMDPGGGGAAVVSLCEDGSQSVGGSGGDGGEGAATGGQNGVPAPAPNPDGYGIGGKGETAGFTCTSGDGGVQGANGENGAGGIEPGKFTYAGYFGVNGADGKPGTAGQGGGGGGASWGKAICGAFHGGAGGGAGGAGGCGGRAGRGGQAGGSSIGVLSFSYGVELVDAYVTASDAGNGGNGGAMQTGGKGGLPGQGGLSFGGANGVKAGCGGGIGGPGGNGGYGGGGHGGHSVALAGAGPVDTPSNYMTVTSFGKAGNGGKGGDPALTEAEGAAGNATKVDTFGP